MALCTVSDDNDSDSVDNYVMITVIIIIMHCNENPIYLFLLWEVLGLSPNFHTHVSAYIFPGSVHIFGCSEMYRQILKIYKSLIDI